MERDFMGLNSKEEDAEAVLSKNSTIHWSLSSDHKSQHNHYLGETQESNIDPHGPIQLTIFYKGMVNVYNDISPEKVEAIMLLAKDGARAQAHGTTPRTLAAVGDTVHVSQPMNTALSSPMHVGPSTNLVEAPKVMRSFRHVMQSVVPQMREASLARFLEKRRERVAASSPYNNKTGTSSAPSKDEKK